MTIVSTPDSPLVGAFLPSPNHGERRGFARPDSVILHYTGMATGQGALDLLRDPKSEVSSHYFIAEDGQIIQLVAEARRAHHAGVGVWKGERDLNSASIGIEIVNPGHDGGLPPFPAGPDRGDDRALPRHCLEARNSPRTNSRPFRHRADAQARSRRALSLGRSRTRRRRPLGRAGADRSRARRSAGQRRVRTSVRCRRCSRSMVMASK